MKPYTVVKIGEIAFLLAPNVTALDAQKCLFAASPMRAVWLAGSLRYYLDREARDLPTVHVVDRDSVLLVAPTPEEIRAEQPWPAGRHDVGFPKGGDHAA